MIDFRTEFFNIVNQRVFAYVGNNLESGSLFGKTRSASDPREIPFMLSSASEPHAAVRCQRHHAESSAYGRASKLKPGDVTKVIGPPLLRGSNPAEIGAVGKAGPS